ATLEARAVAALAAGMILPTLDADAAARLAEAEGLVTHLTSLVLVDEESAAQQSIPATRKVALPAPATRQAHAVYSLHEDVDRFAAPAAPAAPIAKLRSPSDEDDAAPFISRGRSTGLRDRKARASIPREMGPNGPDVPLLRRLTGMFGNSGPARSGA